MAFMAPTPLLLLSLLACKGKDVPDADSGATHPVDLVSPVPSGQARAGVITDPAALFGGISAEGQPGDLMLKNDRVHFVIQSVRDGSYYMSQGGGVIDADIVRPDGTPGRDLLDEHAPMADLGRIPDPTSVTVIATGEDGGPAIVRAEGPAVPLALITGAAESDALLPTADMVMVTDYTLEPDSWLLKMETTIQWHDTAATVQPGDLMLVSFEVSSVWRPESGLDTNGDQGQGFMAVVGDHDEIALGLFPDADAFTPSPLQGLLTGIGQIVVGMYQSLDVEDGQEQTFTRYLGVGPDLSTLTGAWYQARGAQTEAVSGTVVDDTGAGVAGARVHLLDADGAPLTVATTDAAGAWQAQVLPGTVSQAVASGRSPGRYWDVAAGWAQSGPYADDVLNTLARQSLLDGDPSISMAEGRGVSAPVAVSAGSSATLELGRPGFIDVRASDDGPAKVVISFLDGDSVSADRGLVPDRPDGHMAEGFITQGDLRIPVEPGHYSVLVHRGLRWEYDLQDVEVAAGEEVSVTADLVSSYQVPGVLAGDPHMHAAPSNDASATMEGRLMSVAAHGVDLHFGTDHDHVVDYRPMIAPLGLDGVMASVVADEVSPPLRGHFNVYPLEQMPAEANGGSVRWWDEWRDFGSTQGLFDMLRAQLGSPGGIIQVNHPIGGTSGMVDAANYDIATGRVGNSNRWSPDFDAIEVINSGDVQDYAPIYMDMVARGLDPTPVAVSDAHGPDSHVGEQVTFLHLGIDDVASFSNDALRQAMADHATVASMGPYIDASIDGQWAPGRDVTGPVQLDVRVLAPSWVKVDQIDLLRDGEVVQSVAIDGVAPEQGSTSFSLDPDADASYEVVAWGAQPMSPVYNHAPWAMTAAIRVDADGNGTWTPPKPSIVAD